MIIGKNSNPWIYIFVSPKEVVRSICHQNPRKGLFILSSITALHYFFLYMAFHSYSMARHLIWLLPIFLILSPLLGWGWINFQSWAVLVTGKMVGGKASQKELLIAVAWSKVPLAITLFLWFILMVFSPHPFYHPYYMGVSLVLIGLVALIALVWSVAIYIEGVEEVQKVALSYSLINILLAFVLMFFSVMIFCFLYYYILRIFV